VPRFDVVLLGMGPEGHVASIFPGNPAVHAAEPVVAVRECPKPPQLRVSLTFPSIRAGREVWVLVTSAEKAPAVARALSGAAPTDLPVAGVHGRSHTLFLLDEAAAGEVPVELRPRR
jgi:6-phosphogluconolactonase